MNARGIHVRLGSAHVLRGTDLSLAPGTMTLLAGRNGAGKSTLLRVLAGVRRPDAGSVTHESRDVHGIPVRTRARLVTLIPQDSDAPSEFTGRELVMMGRHPHIPRMGEATPVDHAAVQDALRAVDASGFAERAVSTLSGGEARRIAIARALATDAPVLLADEPTANLDLEHALAILTLLRSLAEQQRMVVIASHDLNLTAPHAHRVALLHEGRIRCEGPPEATLSAEIIREVFGVHSEPSRGYFPLAFR